MAYTAALNTDPSKYLSYGKGIVYFKRKDGTSYLDLGEVPSFTLSPEIATEPYYSSRSGVREKVATMTQERGFTSELQMAEYKPENLNIAFLGDDALSTGSQAAGTLDAVSTTCYDGGYVELDKYNLFITKITHGTVTAGPFDYGETITGGTSAATGDVAWVDGDGEYIELINVSGTFQSGETLTGGTSAASATSTNVDTVSDVVVLDDATTPTTRYTLGTDYDVNVQDGMFGLYPGGSASTPVYVSADYEAVDTASIKAMTNDAVEGELKFVGTSDVGPRYTVYAWKVKLSPSGGFGLISEGVEPITIAVEILSDASNHPDYPYIKPIMRQAA